MSSPEPEPADQTQTGQPVGAEPPPDEDSSLIPAIIAAYAAYRLWRAAHNASPKGWRQVALAIGLSGLISTQLALVAARALRWQQGQAGRAGDDLWNSMDDGVKAGVAAGLQTIAEALIWTDTHSEGVPKTQDAPDPGQAATPTLSNPPILLAQITGQAVVNAAIFTAAQAAGWTKKTWMSQEDSRVRDTHRVLDRTTVPMASPFISPSGAKLRFPGDPRAPISEVANCRCWLRMSRR